MADEHPSRIGMSHVYAGGSHDRASVARHDPEWIAAQLARDDALFVPVWRDLHLLADTPEARLLTRSELGARDCESIAFLGLRDGVPLCAIDLSDRDETALPGVFTPLRPVAATLPAPDCALLAHARSLLFWLGANRFCGRCGAPMQSLNGGGQLRCTQDAAHVLFPRVDPVVIVLVRHGERALLAQGTRFPPERRLFSALAGYMEPGESAEEAAAREVFEETGVRIKNVRYHSSQPWPYPSTLMLGFMADADSTELMLDPAEIREARWFTRAEVHECAASGIDMPGPAAIAHHLVRAWLAEESLSVNPP